MSRSRRLLTLCAVLLATFMAAMEMTVVSTAMPTVIADLGGIQHYSWVFTAYIVASSVTVPILGKLADLYGRRPMMLLGIGLFLAGSVASGLSQSMNQLILARTVQGVGAGGMQPMAMTIVGDLYAPAERARVQGLFGAIWGLAGMVGPLIGGLIVDLWSWHWVFFINVPFGIASAGVLAIALREQVERRRHRLDIAGALLLATGIVAVLLGSGGGTGLVGLAVAPVALVLFVLVERKAAEPVLPLSLLRQRVIAVSSVAGAFLGGAMIGTATFLPLYVQGVLGGSPTDAGLAIAPMAIGWPIASALSGRLLPRVGYRPLVRAGFGLTLCATVALALLLRPQSGLLFPRATSALLGFGLGFANTTLLVAVQASVGWKQRGVATASTLLFRTLGGALAVGVLGAVLASTLHAVPSVPTEAANALLGPSHGSELPPDVLALLGDALATGLGRVFWLITAVAAAALSASLLFPAMSMRGGAGASSADDPNPDADHREA